jgi:outer membrane protein assembly factor BamA
VRTRYDAVRFGNTIGDMASYDAFTLGGPYSVRGFNVGELATARRFLETAAELRVPVFGRQVYAFIEHGTDLGEPLCPKLQSLLYVLTGADSC